MPKKKIKEQEEVVTNPVGEFEGYALFNQDKLTRAKEAAGKGASEALVLAEYDKLGGLITTKDGEKLATGSFYDFVAKKPKEVAEAKAAKKPNRGGKKLITKKVGDEEVSNDEGGEDEE